LEIVRRIREFASVRVTILTAHSTAAASPRFFIPAATACPMSKQAGLSASGAATPLPESRIVPHSRRDMFRAGAFWPAAAGRGPPCAKPLQSANGAHLGPKTLRSARPIPTEGLSTDCSAKTDRRNYARPLCHAQRSRLRHIADGAGHGYRIGDNFILTAGHVFYYWDRDTSNVTLANIVNHLSGDDGLLGGLGNDQYLLGAGDDDASDDGGNDSYHYEIGDGEDEIFDAGGVDYLEFAAGIDPEDVIVAGDGEDGYILTFDGSAGSVHLWSAALEDYALEQVRFDDETVWSAQDLCDFAFGQLAMSSFGGDAAPLGRGGFDLFALNGQIDSGMNCHIA
jgi:Ca2+-binding RTX toxin-like protein